MTPEPLYGYSTLSESRRMGYFIESKAVTMREIR